MGEIADDIIDGTCCALCGQYFMTKENYAKWEANDFKQTEGIELFSHGYPVACGDCWEEDCGYEKATESTI